MKAELTIKGAIEALKLEPGDTIVVTFDRRLTQAEGVDIQEQLAAAFPGHAVAIFSDGARLSVYTDWHAENHEAKA